MKQKKQRRPVRQGDVFLWPVESIPEGAERQAREGGSVVLAHGEVTGHRHQISSTAAQLYAVNEVALQVAGRSAVMSRYLDVVTGREVLLRHEEHGPIPIKPGVWDVRIQEEWDDEFSRPVLD